MPELRVPPGRAGRTWLRTRTTAAERAAEQLERRAVLLERACGEAERAAEAARDRWTHAYDVAATWAARSAALSGVAALAAAAPAATAEVELVEQPVLGVRVITSAHCRVPPLVAAFGDAAMPVAAAACGEALDAAVAYAAAADTCARLRAEHRATRRRLRAVRDRWLPLLRQASERLAAQIEQQELEDAVRVRRAVGQDAGTSATP